jgi:Na+/H+ antiporter NhaC
MSIFSKENFCMQSKVPSRFVSLIPFIFFVVTFAFSSIFSEYAVAPLFACTVAIVIAICFTFAKTVPFATRIELFIAGSGRQTAIATCYILVLSALFTYVVDLIGGTAAAVNCGMALLPHSLVLPGLFTIISLFATSIGSSMGTIAAFLPIALGIAKKLQIDPAFISGLVVGGAMLGDNLSIISDTTIAATQTVGCTMYEKFRTNLKLVVPAFLITCAVLLYYNQSLGITASFETVPFTLQQFVLIIPYLIMFILAPLQIDVLAILLFGISAGLAIGISHGVFTFSQSTQLLLQGFAANQSIQEVVLLVLLVAGLSAIVEFNGGIAYLFEHVSMRVKGKAGAEFAISILVFLVNAAVAINTIAILITGPMAKTVAEKFGIEKARMASLIDIVSCICQGVLPYGPQLLLASSLAHVSSMAIIPHLHYQWSITFVLIASSAMIYRK